MQHALAPSFEPNFRTARPPASFQNPVQGLSDRGRPLVVDLEGALLRRSLLAEGIRVLLHRNPLMIFVLAFWFVQGRSVLKRHVLARARLNLATLPVHVEFMAYMQAQSALGREVVLTATVSEFEVTTILRRFPVLDSAVLFDEALEGFGAGRAKRLLQCFPRGFHYAGSAMSDGPVWTSTDHIILVNPSAKVARTARMQGRAITQFPQAASASAGAAIAAAPVSGQPMIKQGMSLALIGACLTLVAIALFYPGNESAFLSAAQFALPLLVAAWLGHALATNRKDKS